MIAIPLLAALLMGAPQYSTVQHPVVYTQESAASNPSQDSAGTTPPSAAVVAPRHLTPEQEEQIKQKMEQFKAQHEPVRKEAIRINELAANIHSEADARKLVDAVAEQLTHHRHLLWAAQKYRHRVAHAEYEAVSDPSGLIPEQRIVDVWNEYVREIDAPEEALVTVAELHSLRKGDFLVTSRYSWKRDLSQSVWTMPNVYAVDANGEIANGCRALETLKVIHEMHENFTNVRFARERVQKGISVPDVAQPQSPSPAPDPGQARIIASSHLSAAWYQNPIRPAAYRYQQEHGGRAYDRLVRRLFDELFPAD